MRSVRGSPRKRRPPDATLSLVEGGDGGSADGSDLSLWRRQGPPGASQGGGLSTDAGGV